MNNITYISASAGSGKTYTLTKKVAELIREGKAEPEQFIITTFTVAAAAEIRQKVKEELYAGGLAEAAERIDQAMIGTIDSVCNALVNRYWYYLGLNPDMNVLTEADRNAYVSESLVDIATQEDLDFFARFQRKFSVMKTENGHPTPHTDFWKEHLTKVVEAANIYSIDDFKESEKYSLELIRETANGKDTEMPTKEEVNELIARLDALGLARTVQANLDILKRKDFSTYEAVRNLCEFKPNKKVGEIVAPFADRFGSVLQSNDVIAMQEEYVKRIFAIATHWCTTYNDFKAKHRVVDFGDMNRLALQLLSDENYQEVRDEIKANYRFAFVDEFQDCSPMQVKIFDRLSHLLERSYWVGDAKQAIYGFRGTDSVITDAVANFISETPNCEMEKPLKTSWRSLPAIVELTNNVFVRAFSEMPEERVRLEPCEAKKKEAKNIPNSLHYWGLQGNNAEDYREELVNYLCDLCDNKGVAPSDICVLGQRNEELDLLADKLTDKGFKANRLRKTFEGNKAADLVFAVMALIENPYNTLARTEVAYLTTTGYGLEQIIDNRLAWNRADEKERGEYLAEVPVVKTVLDRREDFAYHSVKSLVQSIIVQLDLLSLVKRIPSVANPDATLQAINHTAAEYEDRCTQLGLPATIGGFIDYARTAEVKISGAADGITLSTYHTAKGLQWKYVVLTSLNDDPKATDRKNYSGVHTEHVVMPTKENIYTPMLIRVQPWIYGSANKIPQDIRAQINQQRLESIVQANVAEKKRLLYVGMTRAENHLVIAVNERQNQSGTKQEQAWVESIGADVNEMGLQNETYEEVAERTMPETVDIVALATATDANAKMPRDIQPSSLRMRGEAERVKDLYKRLSLPNSADDQTVGNCLHQIFCGIERDNSEQHINSILDAYGLDLAHTDAKQIADAWRQFCDYMQQTYGKAIATHHELAFKQMVEGQIITGSMDFVWETDKGVVLVDYKTNRMAIAGIMNSDVRNNHYPGCYKGQFDCYTNALTAGGKTVIDRLVFYPVSGSVVRIK